MAQSFGGNAASSQRAYAGEAGCSKPFGTRRCAGHHQYSVLSSMDVNQYLPALSITAPSTPAQTHSDATAVTLSSPKVNSSITSSPHVPFPASPSSLTTVSPNHAFPFPISPSTP